MGCTHNRLPSAVCHVGRAKIRKKPISRAKYSLNVENFKQEKPSWEDGFHAGSERYFDATMGDIDLRIIFQDPESECCCD